VRTTSLARCGDGPQLGRRVMSVFGHHCTVGKSPEGSRQAKRQSLQIVITAAKLNACRHFLLFRMIAKG